MNNENEVWRDIEGYEGMYEVSNLGRVKSLKYGKEKILKPERNKYGYLRVCLFKNRDRNWCLIHRLVALTFILNPQNLPMVNHKDENPSNNNVTNLEWCDSKYNNNYGTRNQRIADKHTNGKDSKPVLQYTLDGEFVKEWKSTRDVQRNLGYFQTYISACCLGKHKSAYKFVWKYK